MMCVCVSGPGRHSAWIVVAWHSAILQRLRLVLLTVSHLLEAKKSELRHSGNGSPAAASNRWHKVKAAALPHAKQSQIGKWFGVKDFYMLRDHCCKLLAICDDETLHYLALHVLCLLGDPWRTLFAGLFEQRSSSSFGHILEHVRARLVSRVVCQQVEGAHPTDVVEVEPAV